jgi:hypothetical protein
MYVFGRIGGEWASSQFIKLPLEMNLEAAYIIAGYSYFEKYTLYTSSQYINDIYIKLVYYHRTLYPIDSRNKHYESPPLIGGGNIYDMYFWSGVFTGAINLGRYETAPTCSKYAIITNDWFKETEYYQYFQEEFSRLSTFNTLIVIKTCWPRT